MSKSHRDLFILTWPTEEVRSLWNCTNSETRREENAQITFTNKEVTLFLLGICDNLTFKRSLLKFSPSFIPSRLNTNLEEDMDLPTFCCTTQAIECVRTHFQMPSYLQNVTVASYLSVQVSVEEHQGTR